MLDKEKIQIIKNHKILFIAGMFFFSILINGGGFPIINFNPDNPVRINIFMRIRLFAGLCFFHTIIGQLQALIYSNRSNFFIIIFNTLVVSIALICRYLLEFGEVSNTYNFTIPNIAFHSILFILISTATYYQGKRKF